MYLSLSFYIGSVKVLILRFVFLFIFSFCFVSNVFSEGRAVKQILKIEDLLPENKKWTISTGMYLSQRYSESSHSRMYSYENEDGENIPFSYFYQKKKTTNSISGFTSIQYGLTSRLSPFISVGGSYDEIVSKVNEKEKVEYKHSLNIFTAGLNYQFNHVQPFVVLMSSYSKHDDFHSPSIGLISSWIYDPIVLSITSNYRYNYYSGNKPSQYSSDNLMIGASMAFAINPDVTLKWGVKNKFILTKNDRAKSYLKGPEVNLGLAMNINEITTLSTGVDFGVSNNNYYGYKINFSFNI
ncbi:putative exported protein [Moritella viscosa]|nr:putative exported protein [Moritella viscosa]SHO12215.1 Identified by MetaGeneAnnotator [Moritella viscosa]